MRSRIADVPCQLALGDANYHLPSHFARFKSTCRRHPRIVLLFEQYSRLPPRELMWRECGVAFNNPRSARLGMSSVGCECWPSERPNPNPWMRGTLCAVCQTRWNGVERHPGEVAAISAASRLGRTMCFEDAA